MKTYCIVYKKYTENRNSKFFQTKNDRIMLKSTCPICGNNKSRFISKKNGSGLLSSLGIKTLLEKIPLLNYNYRKMNEKSTDIINRFLLIGNKFMPDMYLWDPEVGTYSTCGPFTRHKQRINDFINDGKLSHILKNKLDAACFQHDSAYSKYKDRLNRKKSDVVLQSKALEIAKNPKINGYQRGLTSIVYIFYDKRTKG